MKTKYQVSMENTYLGPINPIPDDIFVSISLNILAHPIAFIYYCRTAKDFNEIIKNLNFMLGICTSVGRDDFKRNRLV